MATYDVELVKGKVHKETKRNYHEWVLLINFALRRKNAQGKIIDKDPVYRSVIEIAEVEFNENPVLAKKKIKEMIKRKIKDFETQIAEMEYYEETV